MSKALWTMILVASFIGIPIGIIAITVYNPVYIPLITVLAFIAVVTIFAIDVETKRQKMSKIIETVWIVEETDNKSGKAVFVGEFLNKEDAEDNFNERRKKSASNTIVLQKKEKHLLLEQEYRPEAQLAECGTFNP